MPLHPGRKAISIYLRVPSSALGKADGVKGSVFHVARDEVGRKIYYASERMHSRMSLPVGFSWGRVSDDVFEAEHGVRVYAGRKDER